jgi:hypothetical protein
MKYCQQTCSGRIDKMEETLKEHQAVLRGTSTGIGMIAEVDRIKDGFDSMRRLAWAVLTAIVIDIALRLFSVPSVVEAAGLIK